MRGQPGTYCRNRLFEWIAASMMLGMAVVLAASPKAIEYSTFHLMLDIGFTQTEVTLFFFVAGGARVTALLANGRWPFYGPWLRAFGSISAAIIWGQLMVALYGGSRMTGTISPGVPVYFFLVVGEFISCYRAVRDGRTGR